MKKIFLSAIALGAMSIAMPASAATMLVSLGTPLTAGVSQSFSFGGSTFTFGGSGSSSVTVQNSVGAAIQAFGGFAGFALTPSASFTNRGTVTYGPIGTQYASFTSPTIDSSISQQSFVGLRANDGTNNFFGFAYLSGRTLVGYGYESVANAGVTATVIKATSAVPEPASWAMMIGGFGLVGLAMRRRKSKVTTTVAFA